MGAAFADLVTLRDAFDSDCDFAIAHDASFVVLRAWFVVRDTDCGLRASGLGLQGS